MKLLSLDNILYNLPLIMSNRMNNGFSKTLKVAHLVEESYAYNNTINHSKDDYYKTLYLKIRNTIYLSVPTDIPPGVIGLSRIIRNKMELAIGDLVKGQEYQIKDKFITKMVLIVNTLGGVKNVSIHEEEMIDVIKKNFKRHYFYNNQNLILKDKKFCIIILVKTSGISGEKEGYISDDTKIEFKTKDLDFNIITSTLLKRDLFRDDYNFEELGIGGLDKELINVFRRALSTRAIPISLLRKANIKHVKGILLYGPPGTGKTLIARKIGSILTETKPIIVSGPEILNSYVGKSEENIRKLFYEAERDEAIGKTNLHVIIFDEIDAICKKRGRSTNTNITDSIVNQLLAKIDGVQQLNNIFIIAMTNRKDLIDDALLRAGRIEVHIEIGLPDFEGRKQIFRIYTDSMKNNNMIGKNVDFDALSKYTENFSGAEIESVVKNAASHAFHELLVSDKEDIEDSDVIITSDHFIKAIKETTPNFGNCISKLIDMRQKAFELSDKTSGIITHIKDILGSDERIETILLYGKQGTGKTSIAIECALKSNIVFTKYITSFDILNMREYSKSQYISNIIQDAHLSKNSLVVIDDVEICINFASFGQNITFSTSLYQVLMTILKSLPRDPENKINIIVICTNDMLYSNIKDAFKHTIEVM